MFAALLATVLLVLPPARASGPTPVPPNPSSQDAQAAFHAVSSSTNAYSETWFFAQQGSPASTSCGAGCFALGVLYENVSNPGPSLPVGSLQYSGLIQMAFGPGCPATCPPPTVTCDGVVIGSALTYPKPCYATKVDFLGVHVSQVPKLIVTRTVEWTISQGQTWFASPTGGTLTASVESFPATIFGPLATTGLMSWSVLQVSWAVPLPKGSWVGSSTTIQFLNTSTLLTSGQFVQLSSWILVQWTQFPTSVCLTCDPPASHAPVLSYLISIVSATGGFGGGGILPPNGANTTQPPIVPNPTPLNKVVVLPLANVSYQGGGNYTARLLWTNSLSYKVVGPFFVDSLLFSQSSNVSVTANGYPVSNTTIGLSNDSIQLYPGAVAVPNGTSLQLVVNFHYTPSFDPKAALCTVNGVTVNAGLVVGLGVLGVAGALVAAEYNSPRLKRFKLIGTSEGVLMLGALVIIWMGAL